jgi:glycosyltransferase involved in cell wall biosynthesis
VYERTNPVERPVASARPVVVFSIFDWWYHTHGHSDTQLALQFARTRPVLFVNSIGMRVPNVRTDNAFTSRVVRKLSSATRGLRRPVPGLPLHVFSALTVPMYGSERGRRFNAALVHAQVRVVLGALRMRDPLFFVTVPTALPVVAALGARDIVYNRADEHGTFEEADQHYIRELEAELLDRASVVLFYNEALFERERDRVRGTSLFLDHGVDGDRFHPRGVAPERDPLAGIARPRAGFLGGVRDRLVDLDLLRAAALALPDVNFVVVGPVLSPLGDLATMANVHCTGPRAYDEMPAVARALDVALLPYRDTPWMRSANPVKLKEYLATGLPVVSTDFPAVRRYADVANIAASPDAFITALRRAIDLAADEPREMRSRRRATVVTPGASWAAKADQVLRRCGEATPVNA